MMSRIVFVMAAAIAGRWFMMAASAVEPVDPAPSLAPQPVVIVEDRLATDAFKPHPERVTAMIERGLTNLIGCADAREAWRSLISTQDVVGIKVYSQPGPNSGTRPAVVAAVVRGLIAAGLSPARIIIWDKHDLDLQNSGYDKLASELGVRVAASTAAGYDETNSYTNSLIGKLIYGDLEFEKKDEGVGKRSFVSKLVSREITKIINVTPLLNHNEAGVCGHLYSLAIGSVDNTVRFQGDPGRLAQAVPEIYAMQLLSDRVVLNITDALICQYEGGERGLLHYSTVLNQLRFSRDPVALDVLSIKELEQQRRKAQAQGFRSNMELYRNASLLELGLSDTSRIQIKLLK